jgi:ribosomal-protein-alanine N-acetyltransferase
MIELPQLKGSNVTLEPLCATHAAELYPLLSDAELWRATDDVPPASERALADRFGRLESRRSPNGSQDWLNWAVVVATGPVGFVQAARENDVATIAYVIGRAYQSCGYATDGVRAMIEYLEVSLGVECAHAQIDADNEPSRRLLERLGFVLVDGIDRRNQRFSRMLGR